MCALRGHLEPPILLSLWRSLGGGDGWAGQTGFGSVSARSFSAHLTCHQIQQLLCFYSQHPGNSLHESCRPANNQPKQVTVATLLEAPGRGHAPRRGPRAATVGGLTSLVDNPPTLPRKAFLSLRLRSLLPGLHVCTTCAEGGLCGAGGVHLLGAEAPRKMVGG